MDLSMVLGSFEMILESLFMSSGNVRYALGIYS